MKRLAFVAGLCGCDGTVPVDVWVHSAETGCWEQRVERWPSAYWADQSGGGCTDTDFDRYFTRDGQCYHVNGTCEGWLDDPAIVLCEPSTEPCCALALDCAT